MNDASSAPATLPPLSAGPSGADAEPLLWRLHAAMTRRVPEEPVEAGCLAVYLDEEPDAFDVDSELLSELMNAVLQEEQPGPEAPAEIALLAALVEDPLVASASRAVLVLFLAELATIYPRESAAGEAPDSDGAEPHESRLQRAAREAVESLAPDLLARWDGEAEVVVFTLAVLAAACGRTEYADRIRRLAGLWPGSVRAQTLALAAALAEGDERGVAAVLDELAGQPEQEIEALDRGDAAAPPRGQGLSVLLELAQREVGALVFW